MTTLNSTVHLQTYSQLHVLFQKVQPERSSGSTITRSSHSKDTNTAQSTHTPNWMMWARQLGLNAGFDALCRFQLSAWSYAGSRSLQAGDCQTSLRPGHLTLGNKHLLLHLQPFAPEATCDTQGDSTALLNRNIVSPKG